MKNAILCLILLPILAGCSAGDRSVSAESAAVTLLGPDGAVRCNSTDEASAHRLWELAVRGDWVAPDESSTYKVQVQRGQSVRTILWDGRRRPEWLNGNRGSDYASFLQALRAALPSCAEVQSGS